MIWAIKEDERVKAQPKQRAICPLCDKEVIAKCGSIKIWHWAHKKDFVCDSFGEPETDWHLNWKDNWNKECQEVIVYGCDCISCPVYNKKCLHDHSSSICEEIKHRADIKTERIVIELQNTPLPLEKMKDRERFYGFQMIWILNGKTIAKNFRLKKWEKYYEWKYIQTWKNVSNRVYIDKGKYLYLIYGSPDSKGTCSKLSKDAFIVEYGGNPFKNDK